MRLWPLLFVSALTACTQFPELGDDTLSAHRTTAYPQLMPLEALLNAPDPVATPDMAAGIDGRLRALKNRAAQLRRPVVDRSTRTRMAQGVASPF
ncbi:hypothetical protein VK792_02990 [Mesobacterium sp. TK19101]|uniref:Uncharacterized protein n=1 Tax=Mesobacterium hydrothermale TaxID=3111907 RepID=A0ABU6HCN0_9RHOB|nr:hypothetical protein [Mesobacterium sp. TK19101]MEC3860237.1 hypothetical protein [Mesobacterium sp. TK19101]